MGKISGCAHDFNVRKGNLGGVYKCGNHQI